MMRRDEPQLCTDNLTLSGSSQLWLYRSRTQRIPRKHSELELGQIQDSGAFILSLSHYMRISLMWDLVPTLEMGFVILNYLSLDLHKSVTK